MKFIIKYLAIFCLCFVLNCTAFSAPLKISGLNFDNSDRIIFINSVKNDEEPTVKTGVLTNPDRFYFDITNAQLTTPSVTYTFENSVMSEVTISQFSLSPDVVRIVIKYNKNKTKSGYKDFEAVRAGDTFYIKYNDKIVSNTNISNFYTDDEDSVNANTKSKIKVKEQNADNNPVVVPTGINQAFEANANKNLKTDEQRLSTRFYIDKVSKVDEGILIKGYGNLTFKPIFYLNDPSRAIIDVKNANLKSDLRNKTYAVGSLVSNEASTILNSREILRIAQFDKDTVRLVIQGENCKNYRMVVSPDGQSIFIAKRQEVINAKLTQYNAILNGYKTAQENGVNVLIMNFNSPVSLSVFEENSIAYVDIQNSNDMNQASFAEVLKNDYFKDASLVKIASDKFRFQKPIPSGIQPVVKINKTRDEVKIYFTKTIQKQKEEQKKEKVKKAVLKTQKKSLLSTYYMVVIDAGHGGEDKGAIRFGTNESELNLEVAKLVEEYLRDNKIHVTMTRSKDVFLELAQRVEISNKISPDAFVSIHHNASLKEGIKGVETHWYRDESVSLAKTVHAQIASSKNMKDWDTLDRGLCKSQFYVINHTVAPAILVEVGFISNKEELERLKNKKYQKEEAKAIADGIIKYLKSRGEQNGKKKQ